MNEEIWVAFSNECCKPGEAVWAFNIKITYMEYLALLQGGDNAISNFVRSHYGDITNPTMFLPKIISSGTEVKIIGIYRVDKIRISPKDCKNLELHRTLRYDYVNNRGYINDDSWLLFKRLSSPIKLLKLHNSNLILALLQNGEEVVVDDIRIPDNSCI